MKLLFILISLVSAVNLQVALVRSASMSSFNNDPSHIDVLLSHSVHYFKDSLKLTMPRQTGNTCLPAILAYASQEKCRANKTVEYFIDQYESSHPGVNVTDDGVVGSKREIIEYIQSNFRTLSYKEAGGIVGSINAGCPLLTTIAVFDADGQKQAHSVLIIGYDSTLKTSPKIYYMDPMQGKVFKDMDVAGFEKSSPAFTLSIRDCR